MQDTPTVLKKIVARKQQEIVERSANTSIEQLQVAAQTQTSPRGFVAAMETKLAVGQSAVIAEAKKASPSKGVIRENFDPAAIAKSYQQHGAACLSVLTDRDFFQGHEDFLIAAREACDLPVIRKDFIIDPYQVYEARAIGADCILLIAACLNDEMLFSLNDLALNLGMDVLIEVHNQQELKRVLPLPNRLLGINNRDLHTFDTSLQTTIDLLPMIGDDRVIVTESGIHSQEDVAFMREHNIDAFLVGEAFMRADEPGEKLASLFAR